MGEGKIDRLRLFSVSLFALFIALSAWTAFVASVLRSSDLLLISLALDLVLFLAATLAKDGRLLTVSWAWLGADFVLCQALLNPLIDYPGMVVSVAVALLAVDTSNFLELVYPIRTRASEMDERQRDRTWTLLKRHVKSASLFVVAAGVLALAGIAFSGPVTFAANPVLATAVVASATLVLVAALAFERRTRRMGRSV